MVYRTTSNRAEHRKAPWVACRIVLCYTGASPNSLGRPGSPTPALSPTVKRSLAVDGGGSTAPTTGTRQQTSRRLIPSPHAPGGRWERPRCPWRGWTHRELFRTLRGATSTAQLSRPNHPLADGCHLHPLTHCCHLRQKTVQL